MSLPDASSIETLSSDDTPIVGSSDPASHGDEERPWEDWDDVDERVS